MNRDHLVLIVANYPDPKAENFLDLELRILEQKFKKITLIQTKAPSIASNKKMHLPINSNLELIIPTKISYLRKLFRVVFSIVFIQEFVYLLTSKKSRFKLDSYKSLFYYHSAYLSNKRWFNHFFSTQDIDFDNTIFYTYWCDQTTFTLAHYQKKYPRLRFVSRVHGWDLYLERHSSNYLPFRTFIFEQAERIITISKHGREYLKQHYSSDFSNKFHLSYLGVKNIGSNIYYESNEVTSSSMRIVTISSITPVKNLECFIRSLSFIDDIEIEWTHIGSVENKGYDFEIQNLIHEVLVSKKNIKIVFKGFYSAEMVFDYLKNKRIDVVLNCSHSEGLPVSLMEATAAALPIIAFNVGGISEIVKDNMNGFLIQQKNDPVALAEKIKCFYALYPQTKKQFSINSYSIWEQSFDYQKNHEKFGQFLKSL